MDKILIEIIIINLVKDKINILTKIITKAKRLWVKTITKKIIME
jgi:hypothetical protein